MSRTATLALGALMSLCILAPHLALGQDGGRKYSDPGVIDLGRIKITIVDALFVKELQGDNGRFTSGENYRGLVLTLRIQKASGDELTLHHPDLVLHYTHGTTHDVAKCSGMSTFSTQQADNREIVFLSENMSLLSVSTTAQNVRSNAIYVDLFFQGMEQDTQYLDLLAAQPMGAALRTQGWR